MLEMLLTSSPVALTYSDLIPAMTANNRPAGYVASASTIYANGAVNKGEDYNPYMAFSRRTGTTENDPNRNLGWTASTIPSGGVTVEWLRIELPTLTVVRGYAISSRNWWPVDCQLQGSVNGSTFITLSTLTNRKEAEGKVLTEYKIDNTEAYKYYRLYITKISSGFANIVHFRLYGD